MSLRINLNSAALTAHRMLAGSDSALGKSIERLSSGFKINSAADDPAGLVISEKLRAQVGGLEQAIKNAGDATNMVKTAEGALNEVSTLLRSMRDLAVHAANVGATDDAARQADQEQIKSAIASLNNISSETQFGHKKLLDGSAGITSTFSTNFTAVDLSASGLMEDTAVTVDVTSPSTRVTYTGDVALDATPIPADTTIMINGVAVNLTAGMDDVAVVNAINAETATTGVTASATAGHQLVLTGDFGSSASIDVSGSGLTDVMAGAAWTVVAGTDAVATVTDADGNAVGGTWTGDGKVLTDTLGNSITLSDAGNTMATFGGEISVTGGALVFQIGAYNGQQRSLSLSSTAADQLGGSAEIAGETVATIDVTTLEGAQNAIDILDAAIRELSSTRAELGAFQKNVLESSINSLTIAKENIAASESTIRDTDMAAEMLNFTKNQILQQAGTSMLAQANQTPQSILKLLQ